MWRDASGTTPTNINHHTVACMNYCRDLIGTSHFAQSNAVLGQLNVVGDPTLGVCTRAYISMCTTHRKLKRGGTECVARAAGMVAAGVSHNTVRRVDVEQAWACILNDAVLKNVLKGAPCWEPIARNTPTTRPQLMSTAAAIPSNNMTGMNMVWRPVGSSGLPQ